MEIAMQITEQQRDELIADLNADCWRDDRGHIEADAYEAACWAERWLKTMQARDRLAFKVRVSADPENLGTMYDPELDAAIRGAADRYKEMRARVEAEAAEKRAVAARERASYLDELARLDLDPVIVAKSWPRGNDRRYGKPWIGRVVELPVAGRPVLEWGTYENGDLLIELPPGALVMYGQKDHRGGNTERSFGIVTPDGGVFELAGRREAVEYFRGRVAQRAEVAR